MGEGITPEERCKPEKMMPGRNLKLKRRWRLCSECVVREGVDSCRVASGWLKTGARAGPTSQLFVQGHAVGAKGGAGSGARNGEEQGLRLASVWPQRDLGLRMIF